MTLAKNPVMFVVEVGALLTTVFVVRDMFAGAAGLEFGVQIALWLWFTVLFANFAEAMAEARGKAQADSLRKTKTDAIAKRLTASGKIEQVPASALARGRRGDLRRRRTDPRRRRSDRRHRHRGRIGDHRRKRAGDSRVRRRPQRRHRRHARAVGSHQDRITSNPGETFLDRMIALVEGAERQKTPNEIALNILIAGLTLIFLLAVVTLQPYAVFSVAQAGAGTVPSVAVLVSLLVCLIPTTIGGLLSAIGIAGMDRVMQHNVLAMSGKAVEAAGDVNSLLLDKTGTITLGNRQAVEFLAITGVSEEELADAAQLSSLADETPEGRSVVVLAKEKYGLRGRHIPEHEANFIPFSAYTRMSGVDFEGRELRKGATEAIANFVKEQGGEVPGYFQEMSDRISRNGGTPLAVCDGSRLLGIIHLKDIVKGGMKERIAQLRAMGIRSIMITGDNPLTAAAIAAEAGVDDFLAQATPKDKLEYIKKEQVAGRLVAMTGDGTNDAPALAQADVGLAMNTGTMAAKEAGNMVDLDSNPTKLIEVVAIGKQLLITRGALTTFSIANDVAKYFAIIPAMFMATYPSLAKLNIMGLHTPQSAVLAAVIFNALIIIALVPLALRGVKYRPLDAASLLRRNLLIYGIGGIIVPFPGIWAIDQLLVLFHLA